jgi:glutamate--cysteine ligase
VDATAPDEQQSWRQRVTSTQDPAAQTRPITEREAREYLEGSCFAAAPPQRIGVELEWLVHDRQEASRPVAESRALRAFDEAARRPLTGCFSREPGGQWEVSSVPAGTLAAALAATDHDMALIRDAARSAGLRLVGSGTDPHRLPARVVKTPRYEAMEAYFDRSGPWGRRITCSTASVQVCLDAGTEGDGVLGYRTRWRLLHALGPVLVATFANSPLMDGHPSGWCSTRQRLWGRVDSSRTLAPTDNGRLRDPRSAWAAFVLDARLLCIRREGAPWTAPVGVTFRDWLRSADERAPTLADLDYHITTLFPPVRIRGYMELRVIDAQEGDGWRVPVTLLSALLDDPVAADEVAAVLEELGDPGVDRGPRGALWLRAARFGLADRELRRAAEGCFRIADGALSRIGAPAEAIAQLRAFAEHHVSRGRCPADDQLDLAAGRRGPSPGQREELSWC